MPSRVSVELDIASLLHEREPGRKRDSALAAELAKLNRSDLDGRVHLILNILRELENNPDALPVLRAQLETRRKALETLLSPKLDAFHQIQAVDIPTQLKLRPKQVRFLNKLAEYFAPGQDFKRTGFLKYPTGMGKTILMGLMVRSIVHHHNDKRVLILSPRETINEQNRQKIKNLQEKGVTVQTADELKSGNGMPDVMIATYTLAALSGRENKDKDPLDTPFDYIFLDECHRAFGPGMIEFLRRKHPNAIVIGLSATPYLGSEDSGKMRTAFEYFEGEIDSINLLEACEEGDVVPLRGYRVKLKDEELKVGDNESDDNVNKKLNHKARTKIGLKLAKMVPQGETGIFFCAGVTHSKQMAKALVDAGIKAAHVDGTTSPRDKEQILNQLETGEL